MTFQSLDLHPHLLKALHEKGFVHPTAIQQSAVPCLVQGKDMLASAVTGSGKTAAFLLPLLQQWIGKPRGLTRGLVLVPTRELAVQTADHFHQLAKFTPLQAAAVYGGVSPAPQERAFRNGVDLIIATPGRLLDHLRRPYAVLDGVTHLVLDEADRMLDMGFLPDIRRILRTLPLKRQTLFFSATLPPAVVRLAQEMLHHPVSLTMPDTAQETPRISQKAYPATEGEKSRLLLALLKKNPDEKVLVFTRTKHRADRLARFLEKNDLPSTRIHGNLSQPQRSEALRGFKEGRFLTLVATDVAARGIDVEAVGMVCNFDVPSSPEDYIHRIGRTGRAGAAGLAVTLYAPEEEAALAAIEKTLRRRLPRREGKEFALQIKERADSETLPKEGKRPLRRERTREKSQRRETEGPGGRKRIKATGKEMTRASLSGKNPKEGRAFGLFGIPREKHPPVG
jgi:ATP-dependent RNA helicase RhlE